MSYRVTFLLCKFVSKPIIHQSALYDINFFEKVVNWCFYNTNFTDCRLLLKLPKLKYVDLRACRLMHKEVLKKLHAECEL